MFWTRVFANSKRNFVSPLSAGLAAAPRSEIVTPSPPPSSSCRLASSRRVREMDTSSGDRPLLAVIGCTGTGKTKLGVRLAKELDGEVVSADSIQVYKGLDVATNKATEEETDGVPHHMMGTVDWGDECNVHQYRDEALKIIRDIHSRGKVPVVVGGTSYYIESIIYNYLVRPAQDEDDDDDEEDDGGGADLTADAFSEYAPYRNANDAPSADTADAAGRMYADALAEAVRFARTMPAVGRLPSKRYRNTFVADAGRVHPPPSLWPSAVADCETAALYAHGVRVLDAVADALRRGRLRPPAATDDGGGGCGGDGGGGVRYEVLAADVAAGHLERYARADVLSRLDAVLAAAADATDDGATGRAAAVREALCRAHDELDRRTQRLTLALLVNNERTATQLLSPVALKTHAAYFDPIAARELHPHNTRKVFRTIQIYLMRGKQKSKLFEEQRTHVNGSVVPMVTLRFKEVHMMWLTCDVDVLNGRLEKRTDEMVERGLVDELCAFKNELVKITGSKNFSLDFTKGVLQCIGVKQFQQFLELPEDTRGTEEGRKALEEALTAMKYVTKKYARRQMRWINNRFLKPSDKQAVSVYQLDCTDLGDWQRLSDQAVELAQVVFGRKPRTAQTLKPMDVSSEKSVSPVYGDFYCDDCSRMFSNDIQYKIHKASKKHVRVMTKRKRKLKDTTIHCSDSENEDKLKAFKTL